MADNTLYFLNLSCCVRVNGTVVQKIYLLSFFSARNYLKADHVNSTMPDVGGKE